VIRSETEKFEVNDRIIRRNKLIVQNLGEQIKRRDESNPQMAQVYAEH
jgi:hypothetical protein